MEPDERPGGRRPRLPEYVDELDDRDLMDLFREVVAWSNYINSLLAEASTSAEDAETAWRRAEAVAMERELTGATATEAKAASMLSPEVIDAHDRYKEKDAERRAFRAYYENLERDQFFLSRELTRRGDVEPYARRDHRWTGG